jgi:serine O-acetyltransferase
MFENLRADARRLRETKSGALFWCVLDALLFDAGYQATLLHRLAHWFKKNRIPAVGPALARYNQFATGVDIAPAARIGPGLRISHGTGLVIGNGVTIGSGCLLMQNVTLGAPTTARIDEMPTIGDRVTLAAGSAVIGRVTIGDDVFVGALALVTENVPAGSKVLSRAGIDVRPRSTPTATA